MKLLEGLEKIFLFISALFCCTFGQYRISWLFFLFVLFFFFFPIRKQNHKFTAVIGNPVAVNYFFFVDIFWKRTYLDTDLERRLYVHQ